MFQTQRRQFHVLFQSFQPRFVQLIPRGVKIGLFPWRRQIPCNLCRETEQQYWLIRWQLIYRITRGWFKNHSRYEYIVYTEYSDDRECPIEAKLYHEWFWVIREWFGSDLRMIRDWFGSNSGMIRKWFESYSWLFQEWFVNDSRVIRDWFWSVSVVILEWFGNDSGLIWEWFCSFGNYLFNSRWIFECFASDSQAKWLAYDCVIRESFGSDLRITLEWFRILLLNLTVL